MQPNKTKIPSNGDYTAEGGRSPLMDKIMDALIIIMGLMIALALVFPAILEHTSYKKHQLMESKK